MNTETQQKEKVKIRGLARIAGWIFWIWGGAIFVLGFYHAFFGEPEANYYSPKKWDFVSQEQWLRWSGFEIVFGIACMAVGFLCWEFAKRLPEWIEREKQPVDELFR